MATFLQLLVLFTALLSKTFAQLAIWNITGNVTGLDSTCISVLNQPLTCNPAVRSIQRTRYESDSTLATLCNSDCTTAWTTYMRRVNGACGNQKYTTPSGWQYLPIFRAEQIYEQYQVLCLRNTAGQLCNAVMRDALKINPDNQATSSGAAAPASTVGCNSCLLSSMAQIVQQPLSSATEYASALTALQKSCSTTLTVTAPASTTYSMAPSSTATSCQGTTYTIKSGDTCQSIALAQGISTTKLLSANNLPAYCRKFPAAGASICLPSNAKCSPYSLKKGDTCQTIASAAKISYAQIISWNPELGELCGNIDHLANKTAVLCTSTPGGAWVNPSPAPSTTTTTTIDPVFATKGTPMSSFASQSARATLLPNEGYVTPFANNSKLDCATYVTPPVLVNASSRSFSYSCANVANAYGVSVNDLLTWNPSINATGGFIDPCELSGSQQYCVQPLAKISPGITTSCNLTSVAPPGIDCRRFALQNNVTVAAMAAWNPDTGTNCTNFASGTTYCNVVSHFRSSDTVAGCSYWAMANASTPSICTQMANQYKLTMGRFVAWNPSVLSDCSGAVKGFDYCVGTPTVHPGFP